MQVPDNKRTLCLTLHEYIDLVYPFNNEIIKSLLIHYAISAIWVILFWLIETVPCFEWWMLDEQQKSINITVLHIQEKLNCAIIHWNHYLVVEKSLQFCPSTT